MKSLVLGTLWAMLIPLGLHPAFAGEARYELHGFADIDGVRKVDRALKQSFPTANDCINFAITLPAPKPAEVINGHNVIYGYACIRVES